MTDLAQKSIDAIRILSMDAVQKANSGHPGTPMALAPLGYKIFAEHLRHDPADPHWPDRDRFVLSCGHASMFLYSCLYLSGYGLTKEDLENFRQWESKTPGHPEYGYTVGVETTTGPLGQGVGNAVGMAVAEAHLAAEFNRDGHAIVDHWTWFICSDGDLMEGISHEAASFAGHAGLGHLIGFYDDNHITIDGSTDLSYSDDAGKRFEAYGWQVLHLPDVNDLAAIDKVIAEAKSDVTRPTMVVTRTHIGYGSPRQDKSSAHGEPLGVENIAATRKALGWEYDEPFFVPEDVLKYFQAKVRERSKSHDEWTPRWDAYKSAFPKEASELERRLLRRLPDGWEKALPDFTKDNGSVASRAASQVVLNALYPLMPELMGGSADLTPSNGTAIKAAENFSRENPLGRYMHFGIREHGMGAIMNGMTLHGGIIPFGGTFLIFSDYCRPAIRLAALMHQQVIWIFTHDSIGLGEDGPTHQPIEQLSTLRAVPNITVIRPADATETAEAWRFALTHTTGPTLLVLTRQKLGYIDRTTNASAAGLAKGAYVLSEPKDGATAKVVLMSSGSEVGLIMEAQQKLQALGIPARVVSMPSHEIFAKQSPEYRASVLPKGVPRVAIEAAHPMSWYKWVGDNGMVLGVERYGASAPYEKIYEELGLTVLKVTEAAQRLLSS